MRPEKLNLKKIIRDPFYRHTYRHYRSAEILKSAGFFDDHLKATDPAYKFDRRWLTTPIHKAVENLKKSKGIERLAVLLTTGGFSPIHAGHLEMMAAAKKAIEKSGFRVIGGYISPSHDHYVSQRSHNPPDAAQRLRLAEVAVADSDWLMVDPWESRYVNAPLNFTDVILHLQKYLNANLRTKQPVEIIYVFGADNAGFARAFVGKGRAVCVSRPGFEGLLASIKSDLLIRENPRIIFIDSPITNNISATSIRRGKVNHLPKMVKKLYLAWLKPSIPENSQYVIRNDSQWALREWNKLYPRSFNQLASYFLKSLASLILGSFKKSNLELKMAAKIHDLEEQNKFAEKIMRQHKTINLDVGTSGTYKLNLSRLFGLSNGQCYSKKFVARPGYPSIPKQLRDIPAGQYILIDDDIASGNTIKMVQSVLPKRIHICKILTLSQFSQRNKQRPFDIVDFRDFLIGSKDGGLVVKLPTGQLARAPYLLPYVSLTSRAKIPPSSEFATSKKIWRLNYEFHKKSGSKIRLRDTDPAFQKLMRYIGFRPEDSLLKICQWHINKLTEISLGYSK